MTEIPELKHDFAKYRGDGTTRDGRPAPTPGEPGRYLASTDLVHAVNAALAVEQPLLVTGEAGTGKTVLAWSIAAELELGEVELFTVRSDHQGRDLLYEIDNLQRFYDAQVNDPAARDRSNYLRFGPLGRAFVSEVRRIVLIDEIDKAPRDFPNDLLYALDRMELRVPELSLVETARHRPVVVITSNRESQLPDPFLRRCVFHHIEFPDRGQLRRILDERLGSLRIAEALCDRIVDRFLELRRVDGLLKKPATSEMLTWARVLHAADVTDGELEKDLRDLPYLNALIKTREDMARVKPSAA
ncbi:MAG TPA: MoxR family ATPase [Thermoanaerobaculia bacterium]|nr:MoxR family ATPase [Thermoanaerobaculia bacterium]